MVSIHHALKRTSVWMVPARGEERIAPVGREAAPWVEQAAERGGRTQLRVAPPLATPVSSKLDPRTSAPTSTRILSWIARKRSSAILASTLISKVGLLKRAQQSVSNHSTPGGATLRVRFG